MQSFRLFVCMFWMTFEFPLSHLMANINGQLRPPPFTSPAAAAAAECAYASHLARTCQVRAQPHGGAKKKKKYPKQ